MLPANVMKNVMRCQTIIAIDVSGGWDFVGTASLDGDSLSGFRAVLHDWMPGSSKTKMPKLADIQSQALMQRPLLFVFPFARQLVFLYFNLLSLSWRLFRPRRG